MLKQGLFDRSPKNSETIARIRLTLAEKKNKQFEWRLYYAEGSMIKTQSNHFSNMLTEQISGDFVVIKTHIREGQIDSDPLSKSIQKTHNIFQKFFNECESKQFKTCEVVTRAHGQKNSFLNLDLNAEQVKDNFLLLVENCNNESKFLEQIIKFEKLNPQPSSSWYCTIS